MNKNLRWRVHHHRRRRRPGGLGVLPAGEKVNLGLDLKGGVHLVLRVQTDDALRLETETTVERLRDTLTRASVAVREAGGDQRAPSSSSRASPNDQAFRAAAVEPDTVFNRGVGRGQLHLHDEAEHREPAARRGGDAGAADDRAARQRAGRGRADRRAAGRAGPDPGAAARRQRRAARQGYHPLHGAARAEARGAGPVPAARRTARKAYNNDAAARHADPARARPTGAAGGGAPATCTTSCGERRW